MIRRLGTGLLLFLVIGSAFVTWLVTTTNGARWLADVVVADAEVESGSLLTGLSMARFEWQDDQTNVVVKDVTARWQPKCFLQSTWCVSLLRVRSIDVSLTGESNAPLQIPALNIPIDVRLDELAMGPLKVDQSGEVIVIESASARAALIKNVLRVERLRVDHAEGYATLQGSLDLTDEQLVDVQIQAHAEGPSIPVTTSVDAQVTGSLDKLQLNGEVDVEHAQVNIVAQLEPLLTPPRFSLDAATSSVTLAAEETATEFRDVQLSLSGSPEQWDFELNTDVVLEEFGTTQIASRGKGSLRELSVDLLALHHQLIDLQTSGTLELATLQWQGDVTLDRLDLSGWLADAQQPVTGSAKVLAREVDNRWRVEVSSLQLDTSLAGRVAQLSGSVNGFSDGEFELPSLRLALDNNHLQAAGHGRYDLDSGDVSYAVDATWEELIPPIDFGRVALREGTLKITGLNESYSIVTNTKVEGDTIPSAQLDARLRGDTASVLLDELLIDTLRGQITGKGALEFRDEPAWSAQVNFSGIDPGTHWPEMDGELKGRLRVDGEFDETLISIRELDVDGVLRGAPIELRGKASADYNGELTIETLELRSEANQLSVAGQKTDDWSLQGTLQFDDLSTLLPVEGTANGKFSIAGEIDRPFLNIELSARNLGVGSVTVGAVEIEGTIDEFAQNDSVLTANASAIQIDTLSVGKVAMKVSGSRSDHLIELDLDSEPASIVAQTRGQLTDALEWLGDTQTARVGLQTGDWTLIETLALSWSQSTQSMRLAPHCWQQSQATLCVTDPADIGVEGQLAWQLDNLDVATLATLLPAHTSVAGKLNASGDVRWIEGERPTASVVAVLEEGTVTRTLDKQEENLTVRFSELALDARIERERMQLDLELDAHQMGQLSAQIETDAIGEDRDLAGQFELNGFNLAALAPFFAELDTLAGIANAKGTLAGSLTKPVVSGRVDAQDIALATPELPVAVRDGQLAIDVAGTNARFEASAAVEQGGEVSLQGEADWAQDSWQVLARLGGRDITVRQPPLFELRATPNLELRVSPRRLGITGDLQIPWARIELQDIPEGVTRVSRDVVVVDAESTLDAEQEWHIETRFNIVLGDDVLVSGQGVEARLQGDLLFSQIAANPARANGEIVLSDGRYSAYGQKLTIAEGRMLFVDSLQPEVSLTATRTVGTVTAGIKLTGTLERPQTELFATPPQTETNTLSYIVLGRPMDAENEADGQVLTRAALAIGLSGGGRALATQVAEQFGIRDFEIDASDDPTAGTQVVLRGRLSPNLSVRYGVGVLTPDNVLTLRYDLSERLYVEMAQGLENALDFFYSFSF